MKKFIFFLIILAIAALALLYFGWVSIPEKSCGVFFSSVTGYEKQILSTGKFHWRWQKLIPGGWKLYTFSTEAGRAEIELKGILPSGDIFSAAMPGKPDFSYSFSLTVSYTLNSDYIIESVSAGKPELLGQESNAAFFTEAEKEIENLLKRHVESVFSQDPDKLKGNEEIEEELFSIKALSTLLLANMGNITLTGIEINKQHLPDINIYRSASRQYAEISANSRKQLFEAESKAAAFDSALEKRLEVLDKYGQLLTRYPILIEYLRINPAADILRGPSHPETGF